MRSATKSQSSVPLLVGDFTTECMSTTLVVFLRMVLNLYTGHCLNRGVWILPRDSARIMGTSE